MSAPTSTAVPAPPVGTSRTGVVDPRGQRFAAALTSLVLVAALILSPSTATLVLLTLQLGSFVLGVALGPARTPYAWVYRVAVRPRLAPPSEVEDVQPARFAQAVGLGFAAVAVAGYAAGLPVLGSVAAGLALGAAFLNAAFGYCLGCEMYLVLARVASARPSRTGRPARAEALTDTP